MSDMEWTDWRKHILSSLDDLKSHSVIQTEQIVSLRIEVASRKVDLRAYCHY
jgi:hypothetical protein